MILYPAAHRKGQVLRTGFTSRFQTLPMKFIDGQSPPPPPLMQVGTHFLVQLSTSFPFGPPNKDFKL